MKKYAAIGGALALALIVSGCHQTVANWLEENAPLVACKRAESEYADWVAAGKPIDRGGKQEASVIRAATDLAYRETREWCAKKGVIIN